MRNGTGRGHLVAALDVAGEAADLADDALADDADHEGGAVVALGRAGEGAHQELVGLWLWLEIRVALRHRRRLVQELVRQRRGWILLDKAESHD